MPNPAEVAKLLPLVREYGILERKRTGKGVTQDEFIRWSELRARLEDKFPQGKHRPGAERRETLRLPTRMLVEFRGEGEFRAALIRSISRGGIFISTPVNLAIGTEFQVLISIDDGEKIELPVIVVSSGIKGSESATGVGCKFGRLDATQQAIVDEMFATALDTE